jgi:hypothetical protein
MGLGTMGLFPPSTAPNKARTPSFRQNIILAHIVFLKFKSTKELTLQLAFIKEIRVHEDGIGSWRQKFFFLLNMTFSCKKIFMF